MYRYKVGDIVIRAWGKGKLLKNRIGTVTAVRIGELFRTYEITLFNGRVEKEVSYGQYQLMETYKIKLQNRIQATNKTLLKQETEYQEIEKLVKESKKPCNNTQAS